MRLAVYALVLFVRKVTLLDIFFAFVFLGHYFSLFTPRIFTWAMLHATLAGIGLLCVIYALDLRIGTRSLRVRAWCFAATLLVAAAYFGVLWYDMNYNAPDFLFFHQR